MEVTYQKQACGLLKTNTFKADSRNFHIPSINFALLRGSTQIGINCGGSYADIIDCFYPC